MYAHQSYHSSILHIQCSVILHQMVEWTIWEEEKDEEVVGGVLLMTGSFWTSMWLDILYITN